MSNLPAGPRAAVRTADDVAAMLWAGLVYQFRTRGDYPDVRDYVDGHIYGTVDALAVITGEPAESIRTRAQAEASR